MSFNIRAAGRIDDVRQAIKNSNVNGDQLGEAIRAVVLAELDRLEPTSPTVPGLRAGVAVEISGHSDSAEIAGHLHLSVKVETVPCGWLDVAEPPATSAPAVAPPAPAKP
jgi:hypothetical protein